MGCEHAYLSSQAGDHDAEGPDRDQASSEPAWAVAERYGNSGQTVWKWRKRPKLEGKESETEVASEGRAANLDLLNAAVVQTLQQGGSVYVVTLGDLSGEVAAGAVLRF